MYFLPTVDSPLWYILHNASQDTGVTELQENILSTASDTELNLKVIKPKKQLLTAIMYKEVFSIH